MAREISNCDSIIDSRDVIARIEELEGMLTPRFVAGWNMPGYMPDNEPAEFDNAEDAKEYILEELDNYADQLEDDEDPDAAARLEEIRGAIEGLKASDDEEQAFNAGQYHYFITEDGTTGLDEDETEELKTLKDLDEEGESASSDWAYGETLIKDEYFQDYAEQFAEDIGAIDRDARWPLNHIDWEEAAEELKQDYTSIDFDGTTFWIRG